MGEALAFLLLIPAWLLAAGALEVVAALILCFALALLFVTGESLARGTAKLIARARGRSPSPPPSAGARP